MTINITKMSANGQVVIPTAIRELAGIRPSAQFLVLNRGNDILLKHVTKEELIADMELAEKIERADEDFRGGRYTKMDPSMSFEEFDKIMRS